MCGWLPVTAPPATSLQIFFLVKEASLDLTMRRYLNGAPAPQHRFPTFSENRSPKHRSEPIMMRVVLLVVLWSRSTHSTTAPPEGCSGLLADVLLARDREIGLIRSSHEEAIRKLQREIEGLRRACPCTTPSGSNVLEPALPPAAAGPEAMDEQAASGESVGTTRARNETMQAPRLAKAAGRQLLRSASPALYCSKAELRSVSASSGGTSGVEAAVVQLMETNVLCGVCIIQELTGQGIATLMDAARALFRCLHQEENRCDQETGLSRIEPMLPLASIDDRGSLVRMLELVEAGARITPGTPHLSPVAQYVNGASVRCRLCLLPPRDDRVGSWCRIRRREAANRHGLPDTATRMRAAARGRASERPAEGGGSGA